MKPLSKAQATAIRTTHHMEGAQVTGRTNTLTSLVNLGLAEWRYRRSSGKAVKFAVLTTEGQAARADMVTAEEADRAQQAPVSVPAAVAAPKVLTVPAEAPQGAAEAPVTERRIIGRWESDGGTYWVELYRDAYGYGYDGKGCGGFIGNVTEAEALRFIEPKTAGGAAHFHPGKRPMKRTITPAAAPQSDAEAAALLTAEDVAAAVVKAVRWLSFAARSRAEALPASEVLAAEVKRTRTVMRRALKHNGPQATMGAIKQHEDARAAWAAALRLEAATGPVSIMVTTGTGDRIEYAHVPSGDPARVAAFLADAQAVTTFSDVTAEAAPAAPQAPAAPVLGCGHASDRAYPGTDGVSRCEPCFNASTAGVCDHCGKHAAKRSGAYHQMVCSPCLHRDTDARIADARERTPVTVGKVSPWARNSLTF